MTGIAVGNGMRKGKSRTARITCALLLLFAHAGFLKPARASESDDDTRAAAINAAPVDILDPSGKPLATYDSSFALLIGMQNYAPNTGWRPLPGVGEDIPAVRQALEKHGFVVEEARDLTGAQLRARIAQFISDHGLSDVDTRLVIYFAGHGHTMKTLDGRPMGYIVPVDAPDPDTDALGFRRTALPMSEMELYAKNIQTRHALFVFDSCFSGTIFSEITRGRGPSPALDAAMRARVRYFITSGSEGETVPDESVFRREFVKALDGAADYNNDDYVTGSELGEYLSDEVSRKTQTHPQQGPIQERQYSQGQIVFRMGLPTATPALRAAKAYEGGQFAEAVDDWRKLAAAGDVLSRKALGDIFSGRPPGDLVRGAPSLSLTEQIPIDNIAALKWYTLAALNSSPGGGCACEKIGSGTRIDRASKRAIREASARAPELRGRMSNNSVSKAEKEVEQFLEGGSARDLYILGAMYQTGVGVAKNNVRAALFYALAKERGHPQAAQALAEIQNLLSSAEIRRYQNSVKSWRPPSPPDVHGVTAQDKSVQSLRSDLADARIAESLIPIEDLDISIIQGALSFLGFYSGAIDGQMGPQTRAAIRSATRRYQTYLGTDETGVFTPAQYVALITEAASAGHAQSQYALGVMYMKGIGAPQNVDAAIAWLERASIQGLAIAQYALGVLYRDGVDDKLAVDMRKAAAYFAQAAALGYQPATEALKALDLEGTRDKE